MYGQRNNEYHTMEVPPSKHFEKADWRRKGLIDVEIWARCQEFFRKNEALVHPLMSVSSDFCELDQMNIFSIQLTRQIV